MAGPIALTDLGRGACRVVQDGRAELVYVAGPLDNRWAFWQGRVYRADLTATAATPRPAGRGVHQALALASPMPAVVIQVLVRPGETVRKGDTVVLLEAMKMELPIRAPADGTVAAVHCHERETVPAEHVLVELE
jgi:biotin carboxyl carrier protein